MKVLPLDSHMSKCFGNTCIKTYPTTIFFIVDMKHDRASTKIRLALNERNRIEGMMMTYEDRIVQLRGSVEAARALLAELNVSQAEIQGLEEHRALILERFKKIRRTMELVLMTLRRGEEALHMKHSVERLSVADADGIAALMRHWDPEWWREVTAKKIVDRMSGCLWLGIRVNNQLVSIGGAKIDDWGSNISTVVTHESHRNRGYATSIVSALVDQILQMSNLVLIHVETDNAPAVRAYTKIGFKPYRRYFVARAEKL